jgi:hypothetical protein
VLTSVCHERRMSAHLVPRPYGLAVRGRVAFEELAMGTSQLGS